MLKTKCRLPFAVVRQFCLFNNVHKSRNIACQFWQKRLFWHCHLKKWNVDGVRHVERSFPATFKFPSSGQTLIHKVTVSSDTLAKPDLNVTPDVVKKTTEITEEKNTFLSSKQLLQCYLNLSKIRLTGFVVLTAMAGYSLAPGEFIPSSFLFASLGTMLCSCSANTINQWLEVPFDSQMARTKNRVLVRGLLSPLHAMSFGVVSGLSGLLLLLTQVNGLTALLGAANLILYTSIYTPLKRVSIVNTWIGSFVGALPPLMGWAACAGTLDISSILLAGILYSWQFPHFNALSWNLRADYSRAGYRMASVTNPELCRKVALRHSVSLLVLSSLLPVCDTTTWWLAVDSLPLNLSIIWLAWKFNENSDNKSARTLFRFSLLHLPLLMFLILFHKKPIGDKRTDQETVVL